MTQPNRIPFLATFVAVIAIALFPSVSQAGTWLPFGPKTYTRGTGTPVTVTDTFTLLNPATTYTLRVFNGGLQNDPTDLDLVAYSIVSLNGVQIVGPANFNQSVMELDVPITPGFSNTLSVQVRGKPGGVLAIEIVGVDNDPPTITASISPSPNAAGWNNSPVTVTFTCSDKTSGVASCPAPVTVSTEGANQVVSGTATDLAGNTASASTTVNLDMTPPTITASINPPPDAAGYNSGPVTVTFTCSDNLSGVAVCPPPVSVTMEGAGQLISGIGTDIAGNTAGVSITVNISFKYFFINSYVRPWTGTQVGRCLNYGISPADNSATVFLDDCLSSHTVRVVEITPARTYTEGTDSTGNPITVTLRHEVLLFAGSEVIGIGSPQATSCTTCPPSATTTPPTEYSLELQPPFYSIEGITRGFTAAQQVSRLDGDSIILEGIHPDPTTMGVINPGPCINTVQSTTLCPPPPPQLVIQIQKARGAIGSPLVAGIRNLSDNEFWDFLAVAGPGIYPTNGFISVSTNYDLWNKTCQDPTVQVPTVLTDPPLASFKDGSFGVLLDVLRAEDLPGCKQPADGFGWGSVIVLSSPSDCRVTDPLSSDPAKTAQDIGGCIDLSNYPPFLIPPGVTIRGGRRGATFGAQLYAGYPTVRSGFPCDGECMFDIQGDYARVTALRVRGQTASTSVDANNTLRINDGIRIDYAGGLSGVGVPLPAGGLSGGVPLSGPGAIVELIATVDHNDISDWIDAAVSANSAFFNGPRISNQCAYPYGSNNPTIYMCDSSFPSAPFVPDPTYTALYRIAQDPFCPPPISVTIAPPCRPTLANVRVSRNFLHHNLASNGGYGVGVQGRALVDGNTFVWNRHDITANADPHYEYRASHNLVLSSTSNYGLGIGRLQDFDMHGTDWANNGLFLGGTGGYYVEIDGNTFLGASGANGGTGHDYVLRGYPVVPTNYHNNRSLRNESDALQVMLCPVGCTSAYFGTPTVPDPFLTIGSDNQFADSASSYSNPTAVLGVGDFDSDGDDDLFLATGNSWFYSPAGRREWRFLSAKSDTINQLLFGDFDRDGRTDVVALHDGQLVVSWGGISDWEPLNANICTSAVPPTCPSSTADLAVGDFDGDGTPDIFFADGTNWWVSFSGTSAFKQVASSSFRVSALRFGDFDNNGTTDVFSVQNTGWAVSYSPKGMPGTPFSLWQSLKVSLATGVDGVIVADFNGDGTADVAFPCGYGGLKISYGGAQDWTLCNDTGFTLVGGGVGHFSGGKGADFLVWNGNDISVVPSGTGVPAQLSSQDMR